MGYVFRQRLLDRSQLHIGHSPRPPEQLSEHPATLGGAGFAEEDGFVFELADGEPQRDAHPKCGGAEYGREVFPRDRIGADAEQPRLKQHRPGDGNPARPGRQFGAG